MEELPVSQQIDNIISLHPGWKAELLAQLRAIILSAHPDITEAVKWKMKNRPEGLPVWECGSMLCFAEIWKDNIKLLFPKGAKLSDPQKLFNARLESKDIRALAFKEGDTLNAESLKKLVLAAIDLNSSK